MQEGAVISAIEPNSRPAAATLPRSSGEVPEAAPWTGPPDEVPALTRAIARGDRDAFARFYKAWFDRCFLAARRLTGRDESACLDIVQEAMLRVIRRMRPLPDERALEAWMNRVVRSAAIDTLRRDARRAARERRRAEGSADPHAATAAADEVERLRLALSRLPPDDAAAVGLRFGRERTLETTGAGLGASGDAAHGRIRRAIGNLREQLKRGNHD